ncbi:hypothetical protein AJ87_02970 [Rhizobium yanglingense]|nr:hypothetical protein AJ87_02970 [Rhizobium yanglingense]
MVQQDYANKMGAYNAQQGMMQGLLGGALGFGGQLASLSDKNPRKISRRSAASTSTATRATARTLPSA